MYSLNKKKKKLKRRDNTQKLAPLNPQPALPFVYPTANIPNAIAPSAMQPMYPMMFMMMPGIQATGALQPQQNVKSVDETNEEDEYEFEDLAVSHKAAIRIQRHYRGYQTRKTFVSLDINPIVKKNDPARYIAAELIDKVVKVLSSD
jgi:IQ calmodulin-binding motif